jgi:N-carbamoylputrescine amidase
MPLFIVALLQIPSNPQDQVDHLNQGVVACRRAKEMGADLALFPEMWQCGYPPRGYDHTNREILKQSAIPTESPFIQTFRQTAAQLEMGIAITYLEDHPAGLRNAVSLISPAGEILLTYAKVHTCAFDWEGKLIPGNGFPVVDYPFQGGTIRLGCMICMDREFPEAARCIMLAGAEIILVPNACELEQHRLRQVEARAFENMVGIAVSNYPAPQQNGHSIALSPVSYDDHEQSVDMTLVEADEREGIYLAKFDLDQIRSYRAHEVWGDKYRHPELYSSLVRPGGNPQDKFGSKSKLL